MSDEGYLCEELRQLRGEVNRSLICFDPSSVKIRWMWFDWLCAHSKGGRQ